MKGRLIAIVSAISFLGTLTWADPAPGWHDLDVLHDQLGGLLHRLKDVRVANHYDKTGHAQRAEELIANADEELRLAVDNARVGK